MATLTQPIKWHGGKHYLAPWIISHMPPHTHYVEPYFGGGSVLRSKDPEGVSEVVNDLNEELMTFWSVLRSPELFSAFRRVIEATPFSEQQFRSAASADVYLSITEGMVERAFKFFILARQSRQGLMKDFATLSRNRTRRGMNEQVSSWLTAIEGLPDVHARLKRVAILNRPAIDVIQQQDSPNTLFYLDPPYPHETRTAKSAYKHEMTWEDHEALLKVLTKIKGHFLLSSYPNDLYDAYAHEFHWTCETKAIDNKASGSAKKEVKIEALYKNVH